MASFEDPADLARAIYKEVLGVDILADMTAAELMETLFAKTESGTYEFSEADLLAMAVPRLQGGTLLPRITDIVAIHTEADLQKGDLIFCQWNGQYRLFVYVGEGELVQVDTQNKNALTVQNGADLTLYQSSNYCINSILGQLRTYELCVVLRPAMMTQ